ncbi:MAG: hypothetical protein II943_02875 [Victivallales bacterium]|nr:hypothetical protein [Victivallales bacterium]
MPKPWLRLEGTDLSGQRLGVSPKPWLRLEGTASPLPRPPAHPLAVPV